MFKLLLPFLMIFLLACQTNPAPKRPNILLIVADDLGYADLGCYGSEIQTPHLDQLAADGLMFTSFYAASTCSPSRAMLLTGVNAHRCGLGTMTGDWAPNQKGKRGYEGYLNRDVVSFPRYLQRAGYHTSMAGKWHLAGGPNRKEFWPVSRGFDRSFALMQGGAGHFYDKQPIVEAMREAIYFRDDEQVDDLPENFYSSTYYADRAIQYIEEAQKEGKPFFHYLSFTAPHWPLQVPDEDINLYKGKYEDGYQALAKRRMEKMKSLGLIPSQTPLPKLSPNVIPWEELTEEERRISSKRMELYAAMIDRMDREVGRVISRLKALGMYENTLIVFLADNGAEGNSIRGYRGTGTWIDTSFDNSLANLGRIDSYVELGAGWAYAASLPFRWYKAFSTEGGIRVPAMVHYPAAPFWKRGKTSEYASIKDLSATIMEVVDLQPARDTFEGRPIFPMEGKSMLGFLQGQDSMIHAKGQVEVWELFGRIGVKEGKWKAEWMEEPYGKVRWELYDLEEDLIQQHDLATTHPERLKRMIQHWEDYQGRNDVIYPSEPTAYASDSIWRAD
ncbi:MAG: arylsulfatase [Bacteroidota bacterium]